MISYDFIKIVLLWLCLNIMIIVMMELALFSQTTKEQEDEYLDKIAQCRVLGYA